MTSGIAQLSHLLQQNASTKSKKWLEAYMKHVIPFHGCKAPVIRSVAKQWFNQYLSKDPKSQLEIITPLISVEHSEEKYAFSILLQEFRNRHGSDFDLEIIHVIQSAFENNQIFEWANCDAVSLKIISKIIHGNVEYANRVLEWRNSDNNWLKRASAVSFIPFVKGGVFKDGSSVDSAVMKLADSLHDSLFRFHQTACGWMLREYWLFDPSFVIKFLEHNGRNMTGEGVRYAVEKMPRKEAKRIMTFIRESSQEQQ